MEVPLSLRRWFVAHFVVSTAVGLPLLVTPALLLHALGWTQVDQASTRLVGAAFLAIGGESMIARGADLDTFKALLNLKMLWSYGAIFGLMAAVGEGAPPATWALLSAFIAFAGVWTHYRIRFKQLAAAAALDDSDPEEA